MAPIRLAEPFADFLGLGYQPCFDRGACGVWRIRPANGAKSCESVKQSDTARSKSLILIGCRIRRILHNLQVRQFSNRINGLRRSRCKILRQ